MKSGSKGVIGNWKMNFRSKEFLKSYFEDWNKLYYEKNCQLELKLAVPSIFFEFTKDTLERLGLGSKIILGAQDCSVFSDTGAYTGEISAEMMKEYVVFVLIGHSERRKYFNETPSMLRKKIENAVNAELEVIYCVGETWNERENNQTFKVIEKQLNEVLDGLDFKNSLLTIAYEPVWAIGTGKNANANEAEEVHNFIYKIINGPSRNFINKHHVPVYYGGSVDSKNAEELLSKKNIDGVLVGSASLKTTELVKILKIAEKQS